jgi:hypothetical protein
MFANTESTIVQEDRRGGGIVYSGSNAALSTGIGPGAFLQGPIAGIAGQPAVPEAGGAATAGGPAGATLSTPCADPPTTFNPNPPFC